MSLDIFKGLVQLMRGTLKNDEINIFQKELSNKLGEMEGKFTIDRFENDLAICENRLTGEFIKIERNKLPVDIKEGTIIKKLDNDEYMIDIEETNKVSKRIKDKMDKLWN